MNPRSRTALAAVVLSGLGSHASAQFVYEPLDGNDGLEFFISQFLRAQVGSAGPEVLLNDPPFPTQAEAVSAVFESVGPQHFAGSRSLDVGVFPQVDAVTTFYEISSETTPTRFEIRWRVETTAEINTVIPNTDATFGPGVETFVEPRMEFRIRFDEDVRVRAVLEADSSTPRNLLGGSSNRIIFETGQTENALTIPILAGVGQSNLQVDSFDFEIDAQAGQTHGFELRCRFGTQNSEDFQLGWDRWQEGALILEVIGCSDADLASPFGSLDFNDVVAYLQRFTDGSASADLAPPSGALDFNDVVAFLALFADGCP